ncbi:MAG TPA: hypothetical protein PK096_04105 [Candidatus Saccharibacteria bacterium]|nr:hypothetical protein [Candidatus Saccharibacteria bacterium]HRK94525.1 hypothetical protein [Candidatus Saccharibacteria bacterium]
MIKRSIVLGGLSSLLVLGVATPAFALDLRSDYLPLTSDVEAIVDGATKTLARTVTETTETLKEEQEDFSTQKERIEARRAELKAELENRRETIKQRLEGRRLAVCENREERINALIDKGVETSKKRLAAIQRVEEGVKKFYANQELSHEGYDSAVANVEAKEADAIAAIDTVADVNFDCSSVDEEKPAHTVRDLHKQRRDALKAYRQSVKELIAVVREAFTLKKAGTE